MKAVLLAAAPMLLLAGSESEVIPVSTTLRLESLRLPGNEKLGLLGLSSTVELGTWYLGPGMYGAARGNRGGFFTFGLEGGLRGRPFSAGSIELEAGIFIGGGGGHSGPQGGGLMLRPHLGASLPLGRLRLGAELSRVNFPNGGIDSTQVALTLAIRADHLWVPHGGWGTSYEGPVTWEGHRVELETEHVEPTALSRTYVGAPQGSFELLGFSFGRDLVGPWFRFLSASGAARGASSGYAQALAGLGARGAVLGPFGVEARLGVGLGGGGTVDTGGGFLWSGEGALTAGNERWRISAGVGRLRAPGGQLDSRTVLFRISRCSSAPVPGPAGESLQAFDLDAWRVGSGLLIYSHTHRAHHSEGAIQLMTLHADREIGGGFYLTGEAGSAVDGKGGGGYSTGLAGLGLETRDWAHQRLFMEAALGAGGGGNLVTGGGMLTSLRLGWRLELPRGLGLDLTSGRVRSPRGEVSTATLGLGLSLRFKVPGR